MVCDGVVFIETIAFTGSRFELKTVPFIVAALDKQAAWRNNKAKPIVKIFFTRNPTQLFFATLSFNTVGQVFRPELAEIEG